MKETLYSILGITVFIGSFWLSFTSGIRDDPEAMRKLRSGEGIRIMSEAINDIHEIKLNSEVIANEIKKNEEENINARVKVRVAPFDVWESYIGSY